MMSNRNHALLSKFERGPKTAEIIPGPLLTFAIMIENIECVSSHLKKLSELQRRGGIENNSKIIFLISQ